MVKSALATKIRSDVPMKGNNWFTLWWLKNSCWKLDTAWGQHCNWSSLGRGIPVYHGLSIYYFQFLDWVEAKTQTGTACGVLQREKNLRLEPTEPLGPGSLFSGLRERLPNYNTVHFSLQEHFSFKFQGGIAGMRQVKTSPAHVVLMDHEWLPPVIASPTATARILGFETANLSGNQKSDSPEELV